jgi:hypothetical protein
MNVYSNLICIYFNKIYISAYTMVVSLLNKYVKDNENWLLVLNNSAGRGFPSLGSNGKIVLCPKKEIVGPPRYRPLIPDVHFFMPGTSNVVVEWSTLLHRFRNVLGSNLGPETDYSESP